jgi:hypothetical protein
MLLAGAASAEISAPADNDPLAAAQAELRVLEGTERRMREEYADLAARGSLSPSEQRDFEAYLTRLEGLVDEQRLSVSRLQAARDGGSMAGEAGGASAGSGDLGQGETDAERVAKMDAALGSSLSDFDEMLLREQQELAKKEKARTAGTGSESSAEGTEGSAGDSERDGAESAGEDGPEGAGKPSEGAGESAGAETGEEGAEAGAEKQGTKQENGDQSRGEDQVASAEDADSSGPTNDNSATPPDIPDGKDDDIVARQLREAAETEQDPELRDKLWDEYRKYKSKSR